MDKLEIVNKLAQLGLKLIQVKDYNVKDKVDVEDNVGYKYSICLNNLLRKGFNSKIISNYNKPQYNFYNLKKYLLENNIDLKIVGEPFITSSKEKIEFQCICGNVFEAIICEVLGVQNKHQCNECGIKLRFKNRRREFDYYKKEIEGYGFVLLDEEFYVKNIKQKFNIEDSEGYRYYVEISSIKNNNKLLRFYETNPHTIYNIKKYIKDNDINADIISYSYDGCNSLLRFKCSCGNEFLTTWTRFSGQFQHRCNNCSGVKSNLEYLVEMELQKNKVSYKYQYTLDGCRDVNLLPFDFAILDEYENLKLLIEVQGRQHFEAVRFGDETKEELFEKLRITQRHDLIKKDYCRTNQIKLLVIPYWEIKNKKYINIINTLTRDM